jgi:hypothetical protein
VLLKNGSATYKVWRSRLSGPPGWCAVLDSIGPTKVSTNALAVGRHTRAEFRAGVAVDEAFEVGARPFSMLRPYLRALLYG